MVVTVTQKSHKETGSVSFSFSHKLPPPYALNAETERDGEKDNNAQTWEKKGGKVENPSPFFLHLFIYIHSRGEEKEWRRKRKKNTFLLLRRRGWRRKKGFFCHLTRMANRFGNLFFLPSFLLLLLLLFFILFFFQKGITTRRRRRGFRQTVIPGRKKKT